MKHLTHPAPQRHQNGVALITVLLFLLLITTLGLVAARQSRIDLQVATSDQTNTLLLNTSDSVLAHIEQAVQKPESTEYQNIIATNKGVLGYFMLHPENKTDQQLAFCYTPSKPVTLFDIGTSTIRMPAIFGTNSKAASTQGGDKGICSPGSTASYATARNVALTQVVARGLTGDSIMGAAEEPLAALETGTSLGVLAIDTPSPRLALYSVSVVPTLSNASNSTIKNCLNLPVPPITNDKGQQLYGTGDDMVSCLKQHGIPSTALIEEVMMRKQRQGDWENPVCQGTNLTAAQKQECRDAGIAIKP